MLLTFRVSNYRSFRDEVTLSLLATRLDDGYGFTRPVADDGTSVDVLPVVAVLGANASGKSNLLRAMSTMRTLVLTSSSRAPYSGLEADHFLLDHDGADKPTFMEVNFILRDSRYQYGFEIHNGLVVSEWLHAFPHKRTQVLFDRDGADSFQFGKNLGGHNRVIAESTRPDVLFLSAAANLRHPLLTQVYQYFLLNLTLLDVPDRSRVAAPIVGKVRDKKQRAIAMMNMADLGVVDAKVLEPGVSDEQLQSVREYVLENASRFGLDDLSEDERDDRVEVITRSLVDQPSSVELLHQGTRGRFALPFDDESLGTKSWLAFVAHALEVLDDGGCLLVDELDASLHPLLLAEALRMFQDKKVNKHGAQLVFTTHDVTLLSKSLDEYHLSRGQVWLTEKDNEGASALIPLSDYRPRKGEDLARGYLQGRYGGTPRLTSRGSSSVSTRRGVIRASEG